MLDAFKSIDSFPKALDDFRIKTTSGAIGLYFFPTSCINFMAFIVSCIFISLNPIRALYGFLVLLRDEILLQNSKFKIFAYITCSICNAWVQKIKELNYKHTKIHTYT